jgi:hypothetical protein
MKPPAANTASRPFAAFCGCLLVGGVQEAIAANPEALVTATISERMWLLLLYSRSPSREALAPGQGRVASAKDRHLLR